ncbi:MAG: alanyl-tRNA editing protein [Gammaproteobacteria bacterium]|nr:alanyl-tRNA editing protein [Gammaproteobacteria bacterium]
MTEKTFYQDSYQKTHTCRVVEIADQAVILDSTIFYPLGGGQPGDSGKMTVNGVDYQITDTRYGEDRTSIVHFLGGDEPASIKVGDEVELELDWQRRHRLMRMHTSMHLMCHIIPAQATGGSVGETESRIDFDLQGLAVDKEDLTQRMNELIEKDLPVSVGSITEEELDQNPGLVRTMSVQPPRGQGTIRTINIENTDFQPCGGTHVKSTGEIGEVVITKLKNKGKQNKRISLALVSP